MSGLAGLTSHGGPVEHVINATAFFRPLYAFVQVSFSPNHFINRPAMQWNFRKSTTLPTLARIIRATTCNFYINHDNLLLYKPRFLSSRYLVHTYFIFKLNLKSFAWKKKKLC